LLSLSIQRKLLIIGVVSTENKDAVIVALSFLKQNKTIIILLLQFFIIKLFDNKKLLKNILR